MRQDLSLVDKVRSIHKFEGFPYIMICNENSQTSISEAPYYFLHLINRNRIDPAERFIKQEKFGLSYQSACDFESTFFSPA